MKLSQLMAGAGLAALLTGVASAQQLQVDGTVATNYDAENVFASEIDDPNTATDLVLNLVIDDEFSGLGAAAVVDLVITLDNAQFSSAVAIGAFNNTGPANCDFELVDGGGLGSDSITFRSQGQINQCSAATAGAITLPIEVVDESLSANFSWSADLTGGGSNLFSDTHDGDGDATNGTNPLFSRAQALSASFVAGDPADLVLAGPDFDIFTDGGDPAVETTQGIIGSVEFDLAAGVLEDFSTVATVATILDDGTELVVSFDNLEGFEADADPATDPSVAEFEIDAGGGFGPANSVDLTAQTVTFELAAADVDNILGDDTLGDIRVTTNDAGVAIDEQTPRGNVTFAGNLGFTPINPAEGDFAAITRDDGLDDYAFTFRWTGDASAGTRSVIRISGLNNEPASITASLSNSLNGDAFDVDCDIPVNPDSYSNGEYQIIWSDLAACGDFGRADIELVVSDDEGQTDVVANRFALRSNGITDFAFDN